MLSLVVKISILKKVIDRLMLAARKRIACDWVPLCYYTLMVFLALYSGSFTQIISRGSGHHLHYAESWLDLLRTLRSIY